MKRLILALVAILMASQANAATQFDFLLSQVRTSTNSLVGGKVYFYLPGTSTPKPVWVDIGQTTLASNPYTLDANGTAQIYGFGIYRVVIKDSAGATRFDRDNISLEPGNDIIASGPATLTLPTGGRACYAKTDSTASPVVINAGTGTTVMGNPSYELSAQYESACFVLVGTTWVRQ